MVVVTQEEDEDGVGEGLLGAWAAAVSPPSLRPQWSEVKSTCQCQPGSIPEAPCFCRHAVEGRCCFVSTMSALPWTPLSTTSAGEHFGAVFDRPIADIIASPELRDEMYAPRPCRRPSVSRR